MNRTFSSFLADARRAVKRHRWVPNGRRGAKDLWWRAFWGIGTVTVFALLFIAVGCLMAAVVVFIY